MSRTCCRPGRKCTDESSGSSWAPLLALLIPACIGAGAGVLKNNRDVPTAKEVMLTAEYAVVCKTGIKDRSDSFCRNLFDDIQLEELRR